MSHDALKSDFRMALEAGAQALEAALEGLDAPAAIQRLVADIYPGEACVVSSFGAESAIILHLVAKANPQTPVLFVDTGKLFSATLSYRDTLVEHLGLTDIRSLSPNRDHLAADDPDGTLHLTNPDLCCHIRKTQPLLSALRPFKVWISGRKRHHGGERSALPRVEIQDGKLKLNPLYDWSREAIEAYYETHNLPRHRLVAEGYPSIGCAPCTVPIKDPDADPRAGRWADSNKTECGIHIGQDGQISRTS
jgi:phosphoadenosine phosphosulfate reductase